MTRNENDSHFIQRQRWCYTTIQVRTDLRRSLVYALSQCRANCDIRPGCLGVCSVDLEYLQVWSQHNLPRQPGQPSLAIHFWCTSNIWTGPFLLITNRELYLWQIKICLYQKYVVLLVCLCFTLNKHILHKKHEDTCRIFSIPVTDPPQLVNA